MSAEVTRYPTLLQDPPWLANLRKHIGLHEGNSPWIAEAFKLCHWPADTDQTKTPWCSVGMNLNFHEIGIVGTLSAAASSWETWGNTLSAPKHGCIVVLNRVGGHHVTLYDANHAAVPGCFSGLGCNQFNCICNANEPLGHVVKGCGYRWPSAAVLAAAGFTGAAQ